MSQVESVGISNSQVMRSEDFRHGFLEARQGRPLDPDYKAKDSAWLYEYGRLAANHRAFGAFIAPPPHSGRTDAGKLFVRLLAEHHRDIAPSTPDA
ncbi:hypothetical protein [Ferrovibrio sp.]|uniref:hypothetical protein n=1 Tax=Ferrovibrio sp. TaxID=1917215 RepID=UPI003D1060F9